MSLRGLKIALVLFLLLIFSFVVESSLAFFQRQSNPRKIIVFRQEISERTQDELLARFEVVPYKRLRLINAKAARLTDRQSSLLVRDSRVLRIDDDVEVFALPRERAREDWCDRFPWLPWCKPTPTPTPTVELTPTPTPTLEPTPTSTPTPTPTQAPSPFQPVPWGVARVKADDAWSYSTGSGVKVAVLDTGIDRDHPDLDNNLAGCLNLIYWWRSCDDDNGHGTHVAGIIAAENNDFGVVGVAPNASLYGLKVLNRRGSGYLSDIIEALDWAITNKMDVVNMSLGTSSNVASFREAVERVAVAGIVQVAAAGNSGPGENTVLYPAAYPEVIAVAATDSSESVPPWSSRGEEIDLAAPGAEIYSTYRRGDYRTLSGTSMAGPHVTGTVALRLALYPKESPPEIGTILESTADQLPFDPTIVGAGLVNALKSVSAPHETGIIGDAFQTDLTE